jgi:hypothetical protein
LHLRQCLILKANSPVAWAEDMSDAVRRQLIAGNFVLICTYREGSKGAPMVLENLKTLGLWVERVGCCKRVQKTRFK